MVGEKVWDTVWEKLCVPVMDTVPHTVMELERVGLWDWDVVTLGVRDREVEGVSEAATEFVGGGM